MHFAVSLSGEGSGHATRMTALCLELTARHRVTVFCPNHTRESMQSTLPDCRFRDLPGIPTVYRGNGVRMLATVKRNAGTFLRSGGLVRELARDLEWLRVDAVVCDYEPFLPRAARLARTPAILFNHQGVVDRHPTPRPARLVAWLTNRVMMPPATARIVSSFYNGDVGPLLRPEIAGRREPKGDFVVVYARPGFAEHIQPVLRWFPGTEFRVFPSRQYDFAQSLAACRGAIAPAGHQFTSEALHLHKPLLAFPQERQYEQELNARMLERSGWGIRGRVERAEADVARFLKLLPWFPLCRPDGKVVFRFHDSTGQAARRIERVLDGVLARERLRPAQRPRRVLTPLGPRGPEADEGSISVPGL